MPGHMKACKVFHIQPATATLYPGDKPQNVAVTFRSEKEVEIKNIPVLKIQVSRH